MAFNGSGTFNLIAGNPVVTGTTISSTWANNTLSDIATGLSTTITKDGQTTPTANIPMGGFKLTGVGAPTTNGDALRYQNLTDIQAQTYTAFTTAGTSTAYTLTTVPAAAALAEDQRYQVEWHTTSGATPTLARDGLTAKNIKVYDTTGAKVAPATGALVAGVKNDVVYDGTDYVVLEQLPLAAVLLTGNQTIAGVKTFSSDPIFPTPTQKVYDTANGYGGGASNKIRRLANIQVNVGTDATVADDATNGATITINVAGVYGITYVDNFSAAQTFGLSLNASSLTTGITGLALAQRIGLATTGAADLSSTVAATRYFAVNDVIRMHSQSATSSGVSPALTIFSLVRVR